MGLPDAFPLQWPDGWSRIERHMRDKSRYKVTSRVARDTMLRSIAKLGGVMPIVSSNLQQRADGLPYANQPIPQDSGVAVYWVRGGKQEVMACDRWIHPWENMRAIYHAVEGLRSMERAGASQIMERAFQAFQLPEGSPTHCLSWRSVLGVEEGFLPSPAYIRRITRELLAKNHPDKGGDEAEFKRVQRASEQALQEVM